ncbi:MAG TPA: hypothetical protein VN909_00095 [Candidatus Dormibacteraeota bacterium]|nr:hypothetical protein [Candidatus Dormibacteraeota bacterium]
MVIRTALLAVAFVAIALAIVAARPRATPGPFLRDFEAYWAAGTSLNTHADPYGRAIWNAERRVPGVQPQRDEVLPFVGPPATLLVWRLAARLPYSAAAYLWAALLGGSLLALAAAIVRASGRALTPFAFFSALALALAFGPVTSDIALGQLALPSVLGAALLVIVAPGSLAGATAAACLAFAQPNVSLGLLSQLGRNRATLAIAAGAALTYLLGALASGWGWPAGYARLVAAHGAAEQFGAIQLSPASIAFGFGATPLAAHVVAVVFVALAIAAAVVLAVTVREGFARFAAFSALAPFAAGFFHEHDLVVAYAPAVWCAVRTRAPARVFALAGTLLVAVDWLGLAQRPTGIAQSALLAVAALAAFAALSDAAELRGTALVAFAFAACFVAAAWFAAHWQAPIWPDALGAFRAPPGASIAAVWAQEQRASGLFAAVPVWAALRSLSLAGCALLAYAIYRHSSCCRTA